jgi:lactate dehydrogenase-like 2-hydroxyacid dehydrogenase
VNAAGTANEYKTLTDGNGIDITNAPGVITVTVNQMELANVLAFAARHG